MKRLAFVTLGVLVIAGLATGSSGQDKLKKAVYTVTTKNLSVALSAHTSIPLTLGYWSAEGVDIEVTAMEGSTAGLQQLAAGNIQFATVGPEVALMAREKGVKVKSFYVVNGVTIFRVVVPRDSPIQAPADLRGKTIGVSALTSGAVPVARAVVSSGGLNPDRDVKWLTVGVGAPAALAIKQKSVDAMALWGDFQGGLENQGLQLGLGEDELQVRDLGHHGRDPVAVWLPVAEVGLDALAQREGLADVKDGPRGVTEDVNAGPVRQRADFLLQVHGHRTRGTSHTAPGLSSRGARPAMPPPSSASTGTPLPGSCNVSGSPSAGASFTARSRAVQQSTFEER